MGTDKRARQKANRAARQAEVDAEAKSESRGQSTRRIGAIVAAVVVIVGLIALFASLGGGDEAADTITFTPTPAPESEAGDVAEAPGIEWATELPDDFTPFAGAGALSDVQPAVRNGIYTAPPAMTIDTSRPYAAVLDTSVGAIRLELFANDAPETVNNFVNLARDGFFDGVSFHRVLDGFMAQGGDPTGTGTGGPGYAFGDEFDSERVFDRAGLLAMANSGADTNGSQFFITFSPTEHLNGLHTIFGEIVDDGAVLDQIERSDSDNPATVINSVSIVEG